MPIGLMNLLRVAAPFGKRFAANLGLTGKATDKIVNLATKGKRPLWRRAEKPGVVGPPRPVGAINRLYMQPTTVSGQLTRLGGGLFGGSIAADYVARKLAEPSNKEQAQESGVIPSRMQYPTRDELGSQPDIESRVEFEQRKQAKFNKQMKQLMVNYGIVNLVNPTSAKEMLKLGTAILGQDIESMGSQRQAEIFDSIFGGGNVPATAMEAYERVMAAGGTVADAKEISGVVESATPSGSTRAPSVVETKLQIGAQVKQLLAAGRDDEAKQLYLQAIYAGIIDPPTGETGIQMSPEQAAEAFLRSAGAGGSDNIDSDMYDLVKID